MKTSLGFLFNRPVMNDEAVVSPPVADGFIELHLNQMIHISQSRNLINTVVVRWKRQKCCFFFYPLLFLKYESNFFFILFSFTHPEPSPTWPIQRGGLTCISAQHSNITASLPCLLCCVRAISPTVSSMLDTFILAARLWHAGRHFREDDGGPELWNTWELVKTLNLQPLVTVKSRHAQVCWVPNYLTTSCRHEANGLANAWALIYVQNSMNSICTMKDQILGFKMIILTLRLRVGLI